MEKILSHYKILKSLGAGGMGEVYLAQDTKLDRTVALKILPASLNNNPERMRRFIQEAKAASAMKHSNVASIYELGEEQGINFIAMEHIEGETVAARIRAGPLATNEILDVAIQIADALDEAHSRRIIHRDIKPSNIMVTARGQVKVLDFGLAKVLQQTDLQGSSQLPTEEGTTPGLVLGTVPYMSPEQALGKEIDHRSDIFSLGSVLYNMTTARLPFQGTTATETITQIVQSQPAPIARFNSNIPSQLEVIIRKCLEKEPARRYQSAKELTIDLRNLKRDTESEAGSGAPFSTAHVPVERKRYITATILLTVATLSAIYIYLVYSRSRSQAIDSIAVLPFANKSGDPNVEYLSDGITENIIYRLSQISSLRVMARSTVFRYKTKNIDPQRAGKELKVRAVVTGTVQQIGDSLVVAAELVHVFDGSQLWGQQYDRKMTDILSLQQEISQEISERLRLKLTGEEKKLLTKKETNNPEAFQLFLKGYYHWNKRSDDGIRKGIEYFQQAIEKDPNYAMAYVGLADCYVVMPFYSFVEPEEVYPKAKAAALKALQIDETNAEAHASIAETLQHYDWNYPEAEKELKRAISLNPNYATAHHWYSELLTCLGRFEEAIAEAKRAQALDPLSLIINDILGHAYRRAGRTDVAIDQYKKTLEMDPNFARAHRSLAMAYVDKGMIQNAISEMETFVSLADYAQFRLGDLAYLYAVTGRKTEAYKLIDQIKEVRKVKYIPAFQLAIAYIGLGEREEAFKWLEEALRKHDPQLVYIKTDVYFRSLHGDPRYHNLLRRIGLEK